MDLSAVFPFPDMLPLRAGGLGLWGGTIASTWVASRLARGRFPAAVTSALAGRASEAGVAYGRLWKTLTVPTPIRAGEEISTNSILLWRSGRRTLGTEYAPSIEYHAVWPLLQVPYDGTDASDHAVDGVPVVVSNRDTISPGTSWSRP